MNRHLELLFLAGCSTTLWVAIQADACAQETASAPSASMQDGEYITDQGWGHLVILKDKNGGEKFSLDSVSREDGCTLNGEIHGEQGLATEKDSREVCKVKFSKDGSGLNVKQETPDTCRNFCGENGEIEGTYLRIKPGCGNKEIAVSREEFKHFYDEKKFKMAQSKLQPILANCRSDLDWQEEGQVRNDLAVTQFKNGLSNECLATLAPYRDDANKDDDDISDDKPAWYANGYLQIIRAARTNIGLCIRASAKK